MINKKELPYTAGIVDKIITEIEKATLLPTDSPANGEFVAGVVHAKLEIIKKVKELNF